MVDLLIYLLLNCKILFFYILYFIKKEFQGCEQYFLAFGSIYKIRLLNLHSKFDKKITILILASHYELETSVYIFDWEEIGYGSYGHFSYFIFDGTLLC